MTRTQKKKATPNNPSTPANDNATPPKPELIQFNVVHLAQLMPGSGAPPFMLPAFQRRKNVGRAFK